MDFAPKDRAKVYEYIISRFGSDKVSYILTLGTIKDRGSIDVLAKGLKYDNLKVVAEIKDSFDNIFKEYSKIIMEEVNIEELEGAESKSPDFVDHELYIQVISNKNAIKKINELQTQWDKLREDNSDLFYYFDGIKGTIISKGVHPAGMIGSPITLKDSLGVFYKGGDKKHPVSFCSMKAVDYLNFVKFDILGLKTIGIIKDTYRLIGEKWRFAHQIDWNDEAVWEDMTRLNSGVFQFESSYSMDLLSRFQPRCLNDMSLTNASLRPSGKSYRDRLLARQVNPTPSKEIDELLSENNGFLVFQEDTIKFLQNICDMTGSEADSTRRAIGKKDKKELQAQLPKILEGYCNHSSSPRHIAEKEAEEFIQIVSDSSEYQFGLNHSTGYSMNGYMCAMLRYYYPLEFTTSYLNWSENEDDLANGHKLLNHYNINLKEPRFRYSRSEYYPDKETNSIYKGIESVKFLNKQVADYLYTLRDNTYDSFIDLLKDIQGHVDSRKLDILIKLDFFEEFGKTAKLLELVRIYNLICTKKTYKYDHEFVDYILPHANKTTAKTIRDVNTYNVMLDIEPTIENNDIPITERVKAHFEFMGNCTLREEGVDGRCCVVTSIDTKYAPKITAYNILNGKSKVFKIKKQTFKDNKIELFDSILIEKVTTKPKKKNVNGQWITLEDVDIWIDIYSK